MPVEFTTLSGSDGPDTLSTGVQRKIFDPDNPEAPPLVIYADTLIGLGGDDRLHAIGESVPEVSLDGTTVPVTILGGDGRDTILVSTARSGTIDGGADGVSPDGLVTPGDLVDFSISTFLSSGILVDLESGTVTGGGISYSLSNVEKIRGTRFGDNIVGDDRTVALFGNDGDDVLTVGDGDGLLHGGAGHDELSGGIGANTLEGSVGNDTLRAGDSLDGSTFDVLFGGDGNDELFGGADDHILVGGAGDDTIIGGSGGEFFLAGLGVDVLTGGVGHTDFFVFEEIAELIGDTITDFVGGPTESESDTIALDPEDFVDSASYNAETGVLQLGVENADGDFVPKGSITISNKPAGEWVVFSGSGPLGSTNVFLLQTLFTEEDDVDVDFNTLAEKQKEIVDQGADIYNALAGNDKVVLPDRANAQLTGEVSWDPERTFNAGPGVDEITGGDLNDIIDGSDGDDTLAGGIGDDTLLGGLGNDTLKGVDSSIGSNFKETGTNVIHGGEGSDIAQYAGNRVTYDFTLDQTWGQFFARGGTLRWEALTTSDRADSYPSADVERFAFNDETWSLAKVWGIAGFEAGLEKVNAILEVIGKSVDDLPPEFQGALKWLDYAEFLLVEGMKISESENPWKALYVTSWVSLVDAAELGTLEALDLVPLPDNVGKGDVEGLVRQLFELARQDIIRTTDKQFDEIMSVTLPISERMGEIVGDILFGLRESETLKKEIGPTNVPKDPNITPPQNIDVPSVPKNRGNSEDDEDLVAPTLDLTFIIDGGGGSDNIVGSSRDDILQGGDGDDTVAGRAGSDLLGGGGGADIFKGTASDLNGDTIIDFTPDDQLIIEDAVFDESKVTVTEGSAVLDIDADGDGNSDATITLAGTFDLNAFAVTPGTTDTVIRLGDPSAPGGSHSTIAEVGSIALTDASTTIDLLHSYTYPVVIAQPTSKNEDDPVAVRVTDVTPTTISLRLQEPGAYDGTHLAENVSYIVVEAGAYELADGTRIEAGALNSKLLSSAGFEEVAFGPGFAETPAVFSQVQTDNGSDFVVTRQQNALPNGFGVAMQEEEALNAGFHFRETIGWVAIDRGNGAWASPDGSLPFEARGTGDAVTDEFASQAFSQSFAEAPIVLAGLASFNEADTATPRAANVSTVGFDVRAQEETSADTEVAHTAEAVDFLAIQGSGTLLGHRIASTVAEVGAVSLTDAPVTIDLLNSYQNPVVIAQPTSRNEDDPATVRITGVTPDSVSMRLQEPSVNDGTHVAEDVSYMVIEAGVYELPDGTRLEAGLVNADPLGSGGFEEVSFVRGFAETPAVLSQVQTNTGGEFVVTRQTEAAGGGFEVAVQAEGALDPSAQSAETVGWLAIDRGVGAWLSSDENYLFEAGATDDIVTDSFSTQAFSQSFSSTPSVLSSLSSFDGPDTAFARAANVSTTKFDVRAQEETSFDAEVVHTTETVDFLAIQGVGTLRAFDLGGFHDLLMAFDSRPETDSASPASTLLAEDDVLPMPFDSGGEDSLLVA